MKVLKEFDYKLKEVETKTGDKLLRIDIDKNRFFLEQNINKDSHSAEIYKKIKEKNPNFYMFWEIKDDKFTGKVLSAVIEEKEEFFERVKTCFLK
ncbi:MAG: hypothetical protein GXO62_02690 [Epsilonproteobacteria bacterium]|nr:hypothetical protein [Campylobacterota bacterium]